MEADNYVVRNQDPDYRTRTHISIKPDGMRLIDELIALADFHEQGSVEHLSAEEMQTLHKLLKKLLDKNL